MTPSLVVVISPRSLPYSIRSDLRSRNRCT